MHVDEISVINKPPPEGASCFTRSAAFSRSLLNKDESWKWQGLQSGGSRYGSSCPDMIIMIPKQLHPVNPLKRRKEAHEKSMGWVCRALDRCDIGVKMRLFITAEGFFFFHWSPPTYETKQPYPTPGKETLIKKRWVYCSGSVGTLPPRHPPAPPSCSD